MTDPIPKESMAASTDLPSRPTSSFHDDRDEKEQSSGALSHPQEVEDKEIEKVSASAPASAPAPALDSDDAQPEYLAGTKLLLVMVSLSLVMFLVLLDTSIISTAIPRITDRFHSLADVGWYGSAYNLACAAPQPLLGKFYTYFNSKWTFLWCFAVFELGSLICGLASSSKMLIVGRAISGLGASGLQNGCLTILAGAVPLARRPPLLGIMIGFSQLGLLVAPIVGGVLTEYVTWRWCFYINLPIGAVVAAGLVFVQIPDQIPKEKTSIVFRTVWGKLDLIGFAIFAPAAVMFLLGLQYGGVDYPWNSATVIGLLCGAAGTFIIFFLWEYRMGDQAMIPLSLISNRIVWTSCLYMAGLFSVILMASYFLPIYFQSVKGVSPMMSGVYLLPSILSQLFTGVTAGVLVTKIGYYLPFAAFSGAVAAIGNGLLSTFSPTTSTGKWIGFQIILGMGRGAGMQMAIVAIQNSLSPQKMPIGMSTVMFSGTFFGAIFLTSANVIFSSSLKSALREFAPSVDAATVLKVGATAVRTAVSGEDLPPVLLAYSKAINHVFYLAVGCSVAFFVCSWGMGWKDVREKKQVGPA